MRRHGFGELETRGEMRDRLHIGRAAHGLVAGAHAVIASESELLRFAEMIGQQLRFLGSDIAKTLQRETDAPVPFSAAHQQQAFVGGVAHQRVLEVEAPLEATLLRKHNSRGNQLCQHVFQFVVVLACYRFQQGKGKLPADHRGNLGHLAGAAETVEAGH